MVWRVLSLIVIVSGLLFALLLPPPLRCERPPGMLDPQGPCPMDRWPLRATIFLSGIAVGGLLLFVDRKTRASV
jgi:hypothetical protein